MHVLQVGRGRGGGTIIISPSLPMLYKKPFPIRHTLPPSFPAGAQMSTALFAFFLPICRPTFYGKIDIPGRPPNRPSSVSHARPPTKKSVHLVRNAHVAWVHTSVPLECRILHLLKPHDNLNRKLHIGEQCQL